MKTFKILGIIALAAIIGMTMVACGGDSPTSVVKKLHTAIQKGDTNAYDKLMTPQGAQMLAMLGDKAKGSLDSYGGIDRTEETIEGDKAKVKVTYKNGETGDFDLEKVDGKWLVTANK